jgi:putative acetyltransferase
MVILIGGNSATGKSSMAQKLLEKYKIPYFSVDDLKMGLYRGYPNCGFTPSSDFELITRKLWPIQQGIIELAVETNKNIIIEGQYFPYTLQNIEKKYLSEIIFFTIGFSENYIRNNIEIIAECRNTTGSYRNFWEEIISIDSYIKETNRIKKLCLLNNVTYFEICQEYMSEIENIYKWIDSKIQK